MKTRRTITVALLGLLTAAATFISPPRISFTNPDVLYAAAVCKSLLGDADSARQFMMRAIAARE